MLITFSGLDGAGKSTLILELKKILEHSDQKVSVRTMYDDLTVYATLRRIRDIIKQLFSLQQKTELVSIPSIRKGFNLIPNGTYIDVSDKKNPILRLMYKFFRNSLCRKFSLILDILVVWLYRLIEEGLRGHILITDRFFYDSLADSMNQDDKKMFFVRFFLKLSPEPDASIFVDVPPHVAFERKREYPLEYLTWRRGAYLKIFQSLKKSTIVDNTQPMDTVLEELKNILQPL